MFLSFRQFVIRSPHFFSLFFAVATAYQVKCKSENCFYEPIISSKICLLLSFLHILFDRWPCVRESNIYNVAIKHIHTYTYIHILSTLSSKTTKYTHTHARQTFSRILYDDDKPQQHQKKNGKQKY